MSDISLNDLEIIEELKAMPSEEATDVDDIPDQSTEPDFSGDDDVD